MPPRSCCVQNKPVGPRAALFTEGRYQSVEVLLDLMQKVGQEHGGKTRAQVRLGAGAPPSAGLPAWAAWPAGGRMVCGLDLFCKGTLALCL
jgi:hypothetical protein